MNIPTPRRSESHTSHRPRRLSRGVLRMLRMLWAVSICGVLLSGPAAAQMQAVKVWEFEPYEVEVWCDFDASVVASPLARERFKIQLMAELERTFQAVWSPVLRELPSELKGLVERDFVHFGLEDIVQNELVLVVSLDSENTKTIRTYEAALEQLSAVHVSSQTRELLRSAVAVGAEDSQTLSLVDKCVVEPGEIETIVENLRTAQIASALIPRSAMAGIEEHIRPLLTPLPWQTASLFQKRDKLFFLAVSMQEEQFVFKLRELDCPMQFLGPAFEGTCAHWMHAAHVAASLFPSAFAPVARVEEANSTTAALLLKASGLIVESDNPAIVHVGDVMHPIVRRDDRNGVPTLLQPQSWTFAAITESDGIKLQANVYAYSGGTGLQGRRNRRTQRMLLRVRPVVAETDIEVVVRGTNKPQSGCFVYQRDLLTDEFEYLGRTDWRGRFTIPVPDEYGSILPDAMRRKKYQSIREAERVRSLAEAQVATDVSNSSSDNATPENKRGSGANDPPTSPGLPPIEVFDATPFEVALRAPLRQIYIKSGESPLGKLPMVPGLRTVEIAALPDDSHRLEVEAFLKGFQGEIIDLIGLRNLLAARIRLHVKNDKLEQARTALTQLKRLPNYEAMAVELSLIQRRTIGTGQEEAPRYSKAQIDRMFQNTRDLMQKYLQDSLVRDSEQVIQTAAPQAAS